MSRLFLLALLICAASAAYHPCIIKDKEKSDIRVIDIDDFSTDDSSSEESDILTLHLPEKGKREKGSEKGKDFCKTDEDCDSNSICLANIICVKGTRRNLDSLERSANQLKSGRCKDQQCPHVSEHDDSYADKIFIE
ncbi:uncharacterized protein LOC126856983 isoform X1 [Cataglyphis hispanica]|uniref:uncharacterized protein LOC126856983 isoform X1 n=1 Tax=Cataglyphis hispanica TaxID=1086592 RepID=UPI00217FCB09|nr:uncharacterized protein LOC126856983 isoform X1 [Cataglyphis hispanica]